MNYVSFKNIGFVNNIFFIYALEELCWNLSPLILAQFPLKIF